MLRGFMKSNWRLILLAVTALVTGLAIGMLLGLNLGEENVTAVGATGLKSVLPTTRICKETYFTKCTHRLDELVDPKGFIGYTEEEMRAFYGDNAVKRFTTEEVVVTQTVDGCCPAHYLLKHNPSGELCVYMTDPVTYGQNLVKVLPGYSREELTQSLAAPLAEGVVFATLSEIDGYLENMES